jgi:hypothetical protein
MQHFFFLWRPPAWAFDTLIAIASLGRSFFLKNHLLLCVDDIGNFFLGLPLHTHVRNIVDLACFKMTVAMATPDSLLYTKLTDFN